MQREGFGRAALILALILAAALSVLLVRHQRQERERNLALQSMTEKAEPLERELARLERELADAEHSSTANVRRAFFAIGFQLSEPADAELAVQLMQKYRVAPVFVLDAASPQLSDLIRAAHDASCEVVLTAEPFDEKALSARSKLSEAEAADSGAFLIGKADDTAENLNRIVKAGFSCVVRYAENMQKDTANHGAVSLSYSRIKSGGFSVITRLKEAEQNSQTLLIVFDLSALHDGKLSEADITGTLSKIFALKDHDGVQYGTVSEGVAAIKAAEEAHAVSRTELEAFAAEQQKQIDEIRAELDAIYAEWNKENQP